MFCQSYDMDMISPALKKLFDIQISYCVLVRGMKCYLHCIIQSAQGQIGKIHLWYQFFVTIINCSFIYSMDTTISRVCSAVFGVFMSFKSFRGNMDTTNKTYYI